MARKAKTLADFPPEFLDAWRLAAEGTLLLEVESVGAARNLIQRLYTFRKRLAEQNPELGARYYLIDLRVHDEVGNVIVGKPTRVPLKAIIRPSSTGWKDQIRKQAQERTGHESASGVLTLGEGLVPSYKHIPPEPPTQSGTDSPDNVEETLADLGYGTGDKT